MSTVQLDIIFSCLNKTDQLRREYSWLLTQCIKQDKHAPGEGKKKKGQNLIQLYERVMTSKKSENQIMFSLRVNIKICSVEVSSLACEVK